MIIISYLSGVIVGFCIAYSLRSFAQNDKFCEELAEIIRKQDALISEMENKIDERV